MIILYKLFRRPEKDTVWQYGYEFSYIDTFQNGFIYDARINRDLDIFFEDIINRPITICIKFDEYGNRFVDCFKDDRAVKYGMDTGSYFRKHINNILVNLSYKIYSNYKR